jgi:hypothetical protein
MDQQRILDEQLEANMKRKLGRGETRSSQRWTDGRMKSGKARWSLRGIGSQAMVDVLSECTVVEPIAASDGQWSDACQLVVG